MINHDRPLPHIDQESALSDYDQYVSAVPIDALTHALDAIECAAIEADLTETGAKRAAAMAIKALRDGSPFSLVRIGDGEGNILGALDPDHASARHFSTRAILGMMFGVSDFPAHEIQNMVQDMRKAALGADVLGVSDRMRIARLQTLRQEPSGRSDIRGYMGSYESILQIACLLEQLDWRPPCVVSNYVHRQMMDMFGAVVTAARRVAIVGPYDLSASVRRHYGVQKTRTLLIPNQASSSPGQGAKWYPERYNEIINQIQVFPGDLFLVAAGILGKSICHRVKLLGGVALDIGSVVDVWVGKSVRNYHSQEFLARYGIAATNAM